MVSGVTPTAALPPEKLPSLWLSFVIPTTKLPVTTDIVQRMFCTLASLERALFQDPRQTGKRRTARRSKTASSLLVISWWRVLVRVDRKGSSKPLRLRSLHPCELPPQLLAFLQAPRKRAVRTKFPQAHSPRSVGLCVSESWRTGFELWTSVKYCFFACL